MAEGEDHIRFEMTTAAAEEEQLPPLLSRKDKRDISSRSKQSTGSSQATTPAKEPKKIGLSDYQAKKIKVRVELESSQPKKEESSSSTSPLDKKAKVAAADTIVKLMVPFFKSGKIGNKQVRHRYKSHPKMLLCLKFGLFAIFEWVYTLQASFAFWTFSFCPLLEMITNVPRFLRRFCQLQG